MKKINREGNSNFILSELREEGCISLTTENQDSFGIRRKVSRFFNSLMAVNTSEKPLAVSQVSPHASPEERGRAYLKAANSYEEIRLKIFAFLRENPDFCDANPSTKILFGRESEVINSVYSSLLAMMPAEIFEMTLVQDFNREHLKPALPEELTKEDRILRMNQNARVRETVLGFLKSSNLPGSKYILQRNPEEFSAFETLLLQVPAEYFRMPVSQVSPHASPEERGRAYLKAANSYEEIRLKIFAFLRENPDFCDANPSTKILFGRESEVINSVYSSLLAMMPAEIFEVY